MGDEISFVVDENSATLRIDKFVSENSNDLSRSSVAKIIDSKGVLVNGKAVNKNYKCKPGDILTVIIPKPVLMEATPQNIPLDIVFEDNDLLVVNKQKGMVVHPAPGNYDNTLVNALLYHCKGSLSGINGVIRPGIVHRIDKDTSGLLIVAKNDIAHAGLANQIKEHSFFRAYEAVAYGNVKEDSGIIEQPIGRNPKDRKKMAVTMKNSKNAITNYSVIQRLSGFTHLRCVLQTGRTHQIRVHMAYIGHPLAGDPVYGPKNVIKSLNGQCLHAREIGFVHPVSGEYMKFSSELPQYFTDFIKKVSK